MPHIDELPDLILCEQGRQVVKDMFWSKNGSGYYQGWLVDRKVFMHRLLMGHPDGLLVDHINGNKTDNRLCNLRICTIEDNGHNERKMRGGSSVFKGVHWANREKAWIARMRIGGGKTMWLGRFNNEVDAAKAYDEAAVKYHGEFAYTNREEFGDSYGRQ